MRIPARVPIPDGKDESSIQCRYFAVFHVQPTPSHAYIDSMVHQTSRTPPIKSRRLQVLKCKLSTLSSADTTLRCW
jgi:hypothetical protein